MTRPSIDIVTAVIRDGRLTACWRSASAATAIFMKPGGKREPGEDDLSALARELDEEIGCRLVDATLLGAFEAPAANEPSYTVRAATYLAKVEGEYRRPAPRSRSWPGSTPPRRATSSWLR